MANDAWNITFNGIVNTQSIKQCMLSQGQLLEWCKSQYIAHSYVYMPLAFIGFFMLAAVYILHMHFGDKLLIAGKEIEKKIFYSPLLSGSAFFIGTFILIYLIQNDIKPISYLPLAWRVWLRGLLGI